MKKPGKLFYFYLISLGVLVLDQLVKFLIKKIEVGRDVVDWGFFSLTHVHNYGAGFSILEGQNWLFVLIALMFIFLIIFFYDRIEEDKLVQSGFALLLGGTVSNLIDRVSYGFVIDYLDFKVWPVFNIADSAITVGAVLVIIYYILKEKKKKK
ncbi:signal peptidase II [Candidatus Woesearchaeota archaeon]|nr:signal peptidase II [Candidatus Woesearchaeota archaeon]